MEELKDNCKHNRIPRNCYLCYLHRYDRKDNKTPMDTLHEKLSELQIRIAKLEQYKLLQDDMNTNIYQKVNFVDEHRKKQIDENRAVSKHFDELDLKTKILLTPEDRIKDINHSIDHLHECGVEQAKQMKDLTLRICDIEAMNQKAIDANPIKDIYERFEKIEKIINDLNFIGFMHSGKLGESQKNGLTFEEALIAFKQGKNIKRKVFDNTLNMFRPFDLMLNVKDLFANDWEVVQ